MNIYDTIENHFELKPTQKTALKSAGLTSIRDLLYYLPIKLKNTNSTTNKAPTVTIYKETKGIKSDWIRDSIKKILTHIDKIEDPIPNEILEKYNLPNLKDVLIYAHFPRQKNDLIVARKRFAFEEILLLNIQNQRNRKIRENVKATPITIDRKKINQFIKDRFPFTLTKSQKKSIDEILEDLQKNKPMARLLEGDVGSGKTAVAAAALYSIITSRPSGQDFGTLQIAYMAPTEILAKQQFESLCAFYQHLPVSIGLITSKGCKKFPSKLSPNNATEISKTQLKKWVKNGEIAAVVGTHSILQKDVEFKHLSLAIVDEQHRFGIMQRNLLLKKTPTIPHLLSMTATPIPRTLALVIYGDLDISIIDELPPERKPVETKLLDKTNRSIAYDRIRSELNANRQAYVICSRIEDKNDSKLRSVQKESKHLSSEIFPEFKIGTLHGKMKSAEKNNVMQKFHDGDIQILVSTTVIEVGVNVENASVILIENAERFGLAELHQLRGRVLRSSHKPYCFAVDGRGDKANNMENRLNIFEKYSDGFLLAEKDLELRGSGELAGMKQSGVTDVAMESLKNMALVKAAKESAQNIIHHGIELNGYPIIKKLIEHRFIHSE